MAGEPSGIAWLENLDEGRQVASREGKLLFIDFYKTPG